jgi:hypothetical protein
VEEWEEALPRLLPLAAAWAREQSERILREGGALDAEGLTRARRVGVASPERVRVLLVGSIPRPEDPALKSACARLELLGPDTAGLTLGHAIYIRRSLRGDRVLLAHELRHVAQYERYPTIDAYLDVYLRELVRYGYALAPFEVDADRAARASEPPS